MQATVLIHDLLKYRADAPPEEYSTWVVKITVEHKCSWPSLSPSESLRSIIHLVNVKYELVTTGQVEPPILESHTAKQVQESIEALEHVYDPYGPFAASSNPFYSKNNLSQCRELNFEATTPDKNQVQGEMFLGFQGNLIKSMAKHADFQDFKKMVVQQPETRPELQAPDFSALYE